MNRPRSAAWRLALVLALLGEAHAAAPSPAAHFTSVKSFRLRLGWLVNDDWTEVKTEGKCTTTRHFKAGLDASVSVKVVATRVSNAGIYQWKSERGSKPEGGITYHAEFHEVIRCQDQPERTFVTTESGGGVGAGDGRLDVDARDGSFRAFGWAATKEGKVVQQGTGMPRMEAPGGLALQPGLPGQELEGTVPAGGRSIRSGAIPLPSQLGRAWARKPMVFQWSIEPWEASEPPEVSVEPPASYDRWIPQGNLRDPEQPGHRLEVLVKVHKAGKPAERADQRARIQFRLTRVSREPGVCMNWPPAGVAKPGDGLRFTPEENQGVLTVHDQAFAETPEPVILTRVAVSSFDYGAHGVLVIHAEDEDGRELKVNVRGKPGSELSIPRDDDGNHIADAWEEEMGVKGRPGEADDEAEPAGNGFAGDGFTLWEEYRGFRVDGSHRSLDPRRKDLLVADDTSDGRARAGIDYFGAASGLQVRRLRREELDPKRVANFNHAERPHRVDQHGLVVKDGAAGESPQQVGVSQSAPFGPPKHTRYVTIPPGKWGSGRAREDVAHELGHATGLAHHGENQTHGVFWGWRRDAAGGLELREWRIGDEEKDKLALPAQSRRVDAFFEPPAGGGAPIPLRPGEAPPAALQLDPVTRLDGWRLYLGGQDGEYGGDESCIMRYADKQGFYWSPADDGRRYLVDTSQNVARDRLCNDREGSRFNKADHVPFSRGGKTVKARPCAQELVVNDAYE